jgi:mRNA-degrading endonuclease RelE of RelBE toxin-antitoxin system
MRGHFRFPELDICNCICINIGIYSIEVGRSALAEIGALRAFDGRKILSAIEEVLSREPMRATRRRKILPGLKPPFEAVPPVWELRVGGYRVFYDVSEEEKKVYVRAVRRKPPHKTTEEIL